MSDQRRTIHLVAGLTRHRQSPKMLIGLEGAHAFCVSIFGKVEHLRAEGPKPLILRGRHTEDFIEGAVTDPRANASFLDPGAMGGLKPWYYLPSPWRGVTQC